MLGADWALARVGVVLLEKIKLFVKENKKRKLSLLRGNYTQK